MRIGIDARLVWRGLGIAQFVTGLVRHLPESAEVIWFGDPTLAPRPVSPVRVDQLPHPVLDLPGARLLARRAGVDVMHFTANTGWITSGRPPFVLTVHDLLFMDTPIGGRSLRQVVGHRYARRNVVRAMSAASAVAIPSVASAADISKRGRLSRDPVVIANGVDLVARTPGHPVATGPGYALAFSGRDPRKGVDLAIAGWRAAERTPGQLWLLAGAGVPPGLEDDIADEVARGEILVLPYVPRERLHEIVAGAQALIYPSSAEGFGLPVLEAMAAGVPVLSGLTPATREVGGEAILRLDAHAPVASIAAGLRLLAGDAETSARLATAGRRRAEAYSWRKCARAYLELYTAAAENS
ncbi:MAG: glycosyltransferase family 4 protein [Actinomycetota bacterium]|nr:glycosyltransferase family 4 protein [Actinomycetota bacterium]